jgi:hypothetical protein
VHEATLVVIDCAMLSHKLQGMAWVSFERPKKTLVSKPGELEIWSDWISWRKRALFMHT